MNNDPTHAARQARYRQRQAVRVTSLESDNRRLKALAARAATPTADDVKALEAKLAAAVKRNIELARRLNRLKDASKNRAVVMSDQLVRTIRAALHPDRAAGDPARQQRLLALSQEFNSLTILATGQ